MNRVPKREFWNNADPERLPDVVQRPSWNGTPIKKQLDQPPKPIRVFPEVPSPILMVSTFGRPDLARWIGTLLSRLSCGMNLDTRAGLPWLQVRPMFSWR